MNQHLLHYSHITPQMSLLDGDALLNCNTLVQSVVNTLNQAAEEEADYQPFLPLSHALSYFFHYLFLLIMHVFDIL